MTSPSAMDSDAGLQGSPSDGEDQRQGPSSPRSDVSGASSSSSSSSSLSKSPPVAADEGAGRGSSSGRKKTQYFLIADSEDDRVEAKMKAAKKREALEQSHHHKQKRSVSLLLHKLETLPMQAGCSSATDADEGAGPRLQTVLSNAKASNSAASKALLGKRVISMADDDDDEDGPPLPGSIDKEDLWWLNEANLNTEAEGAQPPAQRQLAVERLAQLGLTGLSEASKTALQSPSEDSDTCIDGMLPLMTFSDTSVTSPAAGTAASISLQQADAASHAASAADDDCDSATPNPNGEAAKAKSVTATATTLAEATWRPTGLAMTREESETEVESSPSQRSSSKLLEVASAAAAAQAAAAAAAAAGEGAAQGAALQSAGAQQPTVATSGPSMLPSQDDELASASPTNSIGEATVEVPEADEASPTTTTAKAGGAWFEPAPATAPLPAQPPAHPPAQPPAQPSAQPPAQPPVPAQPPAPAAATTTTTATQQKQRPPPPPPPTSPRPGSAPSPPSQTSPRTSKPAPPSTPPPTAAAGSNGEGSGLARRRSTAGPCPPLTLPTAQRGKGENEPIPPIPNEPPPKSARNTTLAARRAAARAEAVSSPSSGFVPGSSWSPLLPLAASSGAAAPSDLSSPTGPSPCRSSAPSLCSPSFASIPVQLPGSGAACSSAAAPSAAAAAAASAVPAASSSNNNSNNTSSSTSNSHNNGGSSSSSHAAASTPPGPGAASPSPATGMPFSLRQGQSTQWAPGSPSDMQPASPGAWSPSADMGGGPVPRPPSLLSIPLRGLSHACARGYSPCFPETEDEATPPIPMSPRRATPNGQRYTGGISPRVAEQVQGRAHQHQQQYQQQQQHHHHPQSPSPPPPPLPQPQPAQPAQPTQLSRAITHDGSMAHGGRAWPQLSPKPDPFQSPTHCHGGRFFQQQQQQQQYQQQQYQPEEQWHTPPSTPRAATPRGMDRSTLEGFQTPPSTPRSRLAGSPEAFGGLSVADGSLIPPRSPRQSPQHDQHSPSAGHQSQYQFHQQQQQQQQQQQLQLQQQLQQQTLQQGEEDPWRGWTVQATEAGQLFYYHASSATAQWEVPRELKHLLGEWQQAQDDQGNVYWGNEVLSLSSWSNPKETVSVFQAVAEANVFFLQIYSMAGGSFTLVDEHGRTPLHIAAASGNSHLATLLLQSGGGVDVGDVEGMTALHWACRQGHAAIVKSLLDAGFAPNAQNTTGNTPLHESAALGDTASIQLLLDASANPWCRNNEHFTTSDMAVWHGHDAASMLLRRPAKRRPQATQLRKFDFSSAYDSSDDEDYEVRPITPRPVRRSAHSPRRPAPQSPLVLPANDLSGAHRRALSPRRAGTGPPVADRAGAWETATKWVKAARPLFERAQGLGASLFGRQDAGHSSGYSYSDSEYCGRF